MKYVLDVSKYISKNMFVQNNLCINRLQSVDPPQKLKPIVLRGDVKVKMGTVCDRALFSHPRKNVCRALLTLSMVGGQLNYVANPIINLKKRACGMKCAMSSSVLLGVKPTLAISSVSGGNVIN